MVLGLLCVAPGVHPEDAWDERIDAACCPYPEHDPRDYNWPYSHLQYSEVVPDVVGSFVPMTELNVSFPTGAIADYGKPVAPAQLAQQPAVAFALEPDRDASTLHTLAMVDPDVPSRDAPVDGEWLHWLVYDIPGNDTRRGKTLAAYAPPKPAQCAASERLCLREHRVTFVLWEQPGPLALHDEVQPPERLVAGAVGAAGHLLHIQGHVQVEAVERGAHHLKVPGAVVLVPGGEVQTVQGHARVRVRRVDELRERHAISAALHLHVLDAHRAVDPPQQLAPAHRGELAPPEPGRARGRRRGPPWRARGAAREPRHRLPRAPTSARASGNARLVCLRDVF